MGVRVLVVDDNDINREIAKGVLEHAGVRVELANDGEQALQVGAHDAGLGGIAQVDAQQAVAAEVGAGVGTGAGGGDQGEHGDGGEAEQAGAGGG